MNDIDISNMCWHLQKKLFEPKGVYYHIWQALKDDDNLTAVVRFRQLHIYRTGKKILVLAGKDFHNRYFLRQLNHGDKGLDTAPILMET